MISYENIDFEKDLTINDKIRMLNYIEVEYGYGGQYELNNLEGLYEIIYEFQLEYEKVIEMLFNLDDYNSNDMIIYFNRSEWCIESLNENELPLELIDKKLDGELKGMLRECLYSDIEFDR